MIIVVAALEFGSEEDRDEAAAGVNNANCPVQGRAARIVFRVKIGAVSDEQY